MMPCERRLGSFCDQGCLLPKAAGALEAVVAKFPAPLLAARAELLFLPLAARLVNDPSAQCVTWKLVPEAGPPVGSVLG